MTTDPGPDDDRLRAPLLLHSLAELGEVIFPCLQLAGARRVVEVGAEEGSFTRQLIPWAEERGASLSCVEPAATPRLVELCEASPTVELVQEASPAALERLERADAYVIDGDHNYHTVRRELEVIEGKGLGGHLSSLVLLQDIGWPWGRRDLYYAPERLPADAVHPYTYDKGVTLDNPGTVKGGFRSAGEFAIALKEGGPANGVLTAVEDFLDGRDGLSLAKVPSVFGLGVLYPSSAPYAQPLAEFLDFYDGHPLLQRLERNRIALYLKILAHQDTITGLAGQLEKSHLEIRDLRTENDALRARQAELEARLASVGAEIEHLLHSRAFALAERMSSITRLRRAGPGLSRQRLRAALDQSGPSRRC